MFFLNFMVLFHLSSWYFSSFFAVLLIFICGTSHLYSRYFTSLFAVLIIFIRGTSHLYSWYFSSLFAVLIIFIRGTSHLYSRYFSSLFVVLLILLRGTSHLYSRYSTNWSNLVAVTDGGGANSRFLGLVSVWAARSFDQTALRPSVIKRIRQIDVKYITHITSFGVTCVKNACVSCRS